MDTWNKLETILHTMYIPKHRIENKDLRWLARNMCLQNSEHPQYIDALNLLKILLKENK